MHVMEVNATIKIMLSRFLSGEISQEELYKCAVNVLHRILGGDILKIKYLEIWGVITRLIEVSDSDIDNCYCVESVHGILRILSGDECDSFSFAMQIPQKYVVDNLSGLDRLVNKYCLNKCLSPDEIQELKRLTQKRVNTCNTLNDFLELQIIEIINLSYTFCNDDNLEFNLKSTVFMSDDEAMNLEKSMILKVIELYECYIGEKSFFVTVLYNNGIGNISVQV